jgi:hypothetical protein
VFPSPRLSPQRASILGVILDAKNSDVAHEPLLLPSIGTCTEDSLQFIGRPAILPTGYLDMLAVVCSEATIAVSGKSDRFKVTATLCARL